MSIAERDCVLHSWTVQADWNAPTVVGGQGARLRLADGREILDCSSLAECSNLGHQHPRLVEAIREQAEKLCFVTSAWGAEVRAELAEALLQNSGFVGGRVFFTLGGADANENAVKIARLAAGKPRGRSSRVTAATTAQRISPWRCRATVARASRSIRGLRHRTRAAAVCLSLSFGSRNDEECGEWAAAAIGARIDAGAPRPWLPSSWSPTRAPMASSRPTPSGPS